MSFSIKEALKGAIEILPSERPQLEAEILLSSVLGVPRIYLHTHSEKLLTPQEFEKYSQALDRAKRYEPIEYITQKVSFYEWEFEIAQGVLIPRPETEILVSKGDELLKKEKGKKVIELGVGSGVISISLALLNPSVGFVCTDINPQALELTQKNIHKLSAIDPSLQERISLHNIDILQDETLLKTHSFDLFLSNPPYIANSYILPKNVSYEPKEALFGGEVGDEILKEIIQIVKKYRIPSLVCEMGWDQKPSLSKELEGYSYVEFYQDLSGLDRGFVAKT